MARRKAVETGQIGAGTRMRDVAKRAGVSVMTVSRAINEPDKVSADMRQRVLNAVNELGYIPNSLASSLSSSRSMLIGLVVPSIDNSIYTQTIKGLSDEIRGAGFQLMIAEAGYDAKEEEAVVTAFLTHRVSGLVVHSTEHTPQTLRKLATSGVPVVENGNIPEHPVDMVVSYSNREAAYTMTMHLARLGYRNIAFVTLNATQNDRSRDRIVGFNEALIKLGRTPDPRRVIETSRGLASGAEAISRILTEMPEVDAVFFAGDVLAAGALFECQRRGWAVPGRVALASFDDVDLLRQVTPTITTLRIPRYEIGARSGKMLMSRIVGGAEHLRGSLVDLKFEVIQRESA